METVKTTARESTQEANNETTREANTINTECENKEGNMEPIIETAMETAESVNNRDKEVINQVTPDYIATTRKEQLRNPFEDLPGTEEIDKREANVKHFDLGNGRHQAVVYSEPVHFKDGGEWKEYDNGLEETSDRSGRGTLRNRMNELSMEFKQKATPGEPVITLSHAGRQLSWAFERVNSLDAHREMKHEMSNEATDESNAKNDAKSNRTISHIDIPRSVAEVRQGEYLLRSRRSDTIVTELAPLTEQEMRTDNLRQ